MIRRALSFLNLLDAQGALSITNLAVWAVVVKMLLAPQFSGTEVAALIGVLLNYAHKREVNADAKT